MTNKELREYLNKKYKGFKHKNYAYHQVSREYGDYLWFQDRGMFNRLKAEICLSHSDGEHKFVDCDEWGRTCVCGVNEK